MNAKIEIPDILPKDENGYIFENPIMDAARPATTAIQNTSLAFRQFSTEAIKTAGSGSKYGDEQYERIVFLQTGANLWANVSIGITL